MKKNDKLTIIIFISLIISILLIVGINYKKNKKLENVDRKIEYIMGYNYNTVLNKGEKLFKETIELLTNDNVFEYTKDINEKTKYYSINKVKNYKRINNFSVAKNILSEDALKEYMEYKNIIYFENSYYIVDEKINKTNYIGSSIKIDSYDNSKIIFKSINYYCDNGLYIGFVEEIPVCNYETKETKFMIAYIDNSFKISSINEFKQILNI